MRWLKSYKENSELDYEGIWGIDPETIEDIFIEFGDLGCDVKTNFKQKFKQWLFGDVDVSVEKDSPLSLHLVPVIEVKVFKPNTSNFQNSQDFLTIVDDIRIRLKHFGWEIKSQSSEYMYLSHLQKSGTLVEFSLNKINI